MSKREPEIRTRVVCPFCEQGYTTHFRDHLIDMMSIKYGGIDGPHQFESTPGRQTRVGNNLVDGWYSWNSRTGLKRRPAFVAAMREIMSMEPTNISALVYEFGHKAHGETEIVEVVHAVVADEFWYTALTAVDWGLLRLRDLVRLVARAEKLLAPRDIEVALYGKLLGDTGVFGVADLRAYLLRSKALSRKMRDRIAANWPA